MIDFGLNVKDALPADFPERSRAALFARRRNPINNG
jgi:hypothetical protein